MNLDSHLHCLMMLGCDKALTEVRQLIKGESARGIIKIRHIETRFGWADEYYPDSISESHVNSVRNYIRDQEEYHRSRTREQ